MVWAELDYIKKFEYRAITTTSFWAGLMVTFRVALLLFIKPNLNFDKMV